MIIDKLYEEVRKKGPVCVGLDTAISYIPEFFKNRFFFEEEMLFNFNKKIIDATLDVSACYKLQIAYYESLGISGLFAYKKTLEYLKERGAIAIGDIKRGDIQDTAKMYAKAHFAGDFEADFITLSPYMGLDSIEPYIPYLESGKKGVFILVRTSNKGAEDIQYIKTEDNSKVYNKVAEKLNTLSEKYIGKYSYSSMGAVVGCTHEEENKELRSKLKNMFLLIPGYGAQGGQASLIREYLKDGNGGIVNSSRGILLAYKKVENGEKSFDECARNEVLKMRDEILKG